MSDSVTSFGEVISELRMAKSLVGLNRDKKKSVDLILLPLYQSEQCGLDFTKWDVGIPEKGIGIGHNGK